jgi:hypothetical protein
VKRIPKAKKLNNTAPQPKTAPVVIKKSATVQGGGSYLDDIFDSPLNAHLAPAVKKPTQPKPSNALTLSRPKPSNVLGLQRKEAAKPQLRALRKPKQFVPPSQRPGAKPGRESLSDQLAKIGDSASTFTNDMRKKHGLPEPAAGVLKSTPSSKFVVGRLDCKFPSPVQFYGNRCVYTFHHPFQSAEIRMEMFYSDMKSAQVSGRTFQFKIGHALREFGDDYNFRNPQHYVMIEMSTGGDAEWVKRNILQKIGSKLSSSGTHVGKW